MKSFIISALLMALMLVSANAQTTVSHLPAVIANTMIGLDIPTNRPILPTPNVCEDKCDPYYVNCVNKNCLPSDCVEDIVKCKKACRLDTCKNGYFFVAVCPFFFSHRVAALRFHSTSTT